MKGIKATKIIHNLQVSNSFGFVDFTENKNNPRKLISFYILLLSNWVQCTPVPPARGKGGGEMGVPSVFNPGQFPQIWDPDSSTGSLFLEMEP